MRKKKSLLAQDREILKHYHKNIYKHHKIDIGTRDADTFMNEGMCNGNKKKWRDGRKGIKVR